ncbi:MAG: tRNA threonylcarbamoyladenosine dehydratase [Candidatus Methanomethylophilus sp.]|nr:tRNA threonylcarbamoyladenosine dehydratase [Methanomethylophilus sp.]
MTESMYYRTRILVGHEGIEKLRRARVIVCGCGAVGGYVIEGLVRAGIGKLRVVDKDVFSESNLNRQVLCTTETVGRIKSEVACERARLINPDIDIEGIDEYISADSVDMILEGDWDILVDAIDTIGNKAVIDKAALDRGLPVYASMGAAMHFDPSAVRIATLKKTDTCPLASQLRKQMSDVDTSDMTYVYSTEPVTVKTEKRDEHGKGILGSLPTVPAIFGMTLASLVIRRITGC